jgi:hypothetical protein
MVSSRVTPAGNIFPKPVFGNETARSRGHLRSGIIKVVHPR